MMAGNPFDWPYPLQRGQIARNSSLFLWFVAAYLLLLLAAAVAAWVLI